MTKSPKCEWCEKGDKAEMLDINGVLCSLSGESGQLSHAYGDDWWACPRLRCPLCNQPAYSIVEKRGEDGLGGYWVCGTCETGMSECSCTRPAGQPHERGCPAILEAWEKAFAAICTTPAAVPNLAESLAKESFVAGYVFASDPEAFDILIRPPE